MSMSELGAYLQRHREERGWSLEEVEALTRIRRRYLQAMEAGEWDDLPPGVYTRGLLRNYAHTLGVSVAGVLRMYAKERPHEARLPEPQLISRPLTSEPRLSFELVLAGILLVVAVGLIAWVLGTQLPAYLDAAREPDELQTLAVGIPTTTETPEPTSALPGRRRTAEPAAPSTPSPDRLPTGEDSVESASPAAPTGDAGRGTALTARTTGTTTRPGTATGTAAATDAAARAASGTPRAAVATAGLELEVVATADAWILVTADGEQAYTGFVRKGERRTWRADNRIGLRTGNAGGTSVTLNGNRLRALGDSGEVHEREWRLLANGDIEERTL